MAAGSNRPGGSPHLPVTDCRGPGVIGGFKMVDPVRVKYFVELCHYKNYTKTAERLYISQPALSRHIHILEQELGVTLIEPNRKKFQLTPEGEDFLKLAKDFQQHESEFDNACRALKHGSSTVLRVGFPVYFAFSNIFKATEIMHRRSPGVQIDFTAYPQQSLMLPDLINDNIDVALACRDVLGQIPKLHYELIARNYVAVLLSSQHHLWGRHSISIEELRNERIYIPLRESSSAAFTGLVNYLQRADIFIEDYGFDQCFEEQLLRIFKGDCVSLDHMYGSDLILNMEESFARIPIMDSSVGFGNVTVAYKQSSPVISDLVASLKESFPAVSFD